MASKEAVLELICEAKSVNIDEGRICFLRNIIEKDLDLLEEYRKIEEEIGVDFTCQKSSLSGWNQTETKKITMTTLNSTISSAMPSRTKSGGQSKTSDTKSYHPGNQSGKENQPNPFCGNVILQRI